MDPPADIVQSFVRGLDVMRAFGPDNPEMTVTDVARATGLTRAAARRFLLTLVHFGYARTDGKNFALRARVMEIGYSFLSGLGLPDLAQPHLDALNRLIQRTVAVSILDGAESVYVARTTSRRLLTAFGFNVGTRFPAYASAQGRILLSGMSRDWLEGYLASVHLLPLTVRTITDKDALRAAVAQVRDAGWAWVEEELEETLCSLAVPIRGGNGEVIASLSMTAHSDRDLDLDELIAQLSASARDIEDEVRMLPRGPHRIPTVEVS